VRSRTGLPTAAFYGAEGEERTGLAQPA
jgi:hypothetical protein